MENVFAQIGEITTTASAQTEPVLQKPKRCAFIFITAEADSCDGAIEDLRKIEAVEEVYRARGAYDLVAKVSGESLDDLHDVVHKRIRNLDSIKSTLTLTVI
ncbi:MAG: Lrp/AsnC ligand binding domain-containing protein [Candidatus Bathyarchaeota archaeon]|nr:Lrp/AsnC ligand binding domain-containing protein [Candidatus Bathyarchaeota archaeon]